MAITREAGQALLMGIFVKNTSLQIELSGRAGAERCQSERIPIPALEKYFSPMELGQAWGLSADSIRRLFLKEPGVLVMNGDARHGHRRYRTLRIPASVAERVHRRLTTVV